MSLKDYENVIVKAHDMGALWPERCVSREDIASVEAKLGVLFDFQNLQQIYFLLRLFFIRANRKILTARNRWSNGKLFDES